MAAVCCCGLVPPANAGAVTDPGGLQGEVNTQQRALDSEVGNYALVDFNHHPGRQRLSFEPVDGWAVIGQLTRATLNGVTDAGVLNIDFDRVSPYGRIPVADDSRSSGGQYSLAYNTRNSGVAQLRFDQAVNGVGFVIHRLFADAVVTLYDAQDEKIAVYSVPANTGAGGSSFSFVGHHEATARVRKLSIDASGQTGNQWWLDDLSVLIGNTPPPSSEPVRSAGINRNHRLMTEEVGNLGLAELDAHADIRLVDFEHPDTWHQLGNSQLDSVQISADDPADDIALRLGAVSPYGRIPVGSLARASSGKHSLAYNTRNSGTAELAFDRAVGGVGFVLHRLYGEVIVNLYDRDNLLLASHRIAANSAAGQSQFSFFGYHDSAVRLRRVVIDASAQGGNQWWLDDVAVIARSQRGAAQPNVSGVTGAQIDESQPTQTLHVSLAGNDAHSGSASQPLHSLGEAARRASTAQAQGQSTRVLIAAGTYREQVELPTAGEGAGDAVIIFEALEPGAVTVSGAERWTGWQADGAGIVSADWPHDWGLSLAIDDLPLYVQRHLQANPVLRRREMFLADGRLLRQVLSDAELRAQADSFFIDEAQDRVSLHLAGDAEIADTVIEAAQREYLFTAREPRNLVIRGIRFSHAANTLLGDGAVHFENADNVLLENNRVDWNGGTGWSFKGTVDTGVIPARYRGNQRLTLRGNSANHNGIAGFETLQTDNTLFEDNDSSFNNWRGAWGDLRWGWTGNRLYRMHRAIIRRHTALGNQARGLWFDFDGADILLQDSHLNGNWDGLKFEVVEGPIRVENSEIVGNQQDGLLVRIAQDLSLVGNRIANNGERQIHVTDETSHYVSNWQYQYPHGTLYLVRWTLRDNEIAGAGESRLLAAPNEGHFLDSLLAGGNRWAHAQRADGFQLDAMDYDFGGWQALTGQGSDSVFSLSASD